MENQRSVRLIVEPGQASLVGGLVELPVSVRALDANDEPVSGLQVVLQNSEPTFFGRLSRSDGETFMTETDGGLYAATLVLPYRFVWLLTAFVSETNIFGNTSYTTLDQDLVSVVRLGQGDDLPATTITTTDTGEKPPKCICCLRIIRSLCRLFCLFFKDYCARQRRNHCIAFFDLLEREFNPGIFLLRLEDLKRQNKVPEMQALIRRYECLDILLQIINLLMRHEASNTPYTIQTLIDILADEDIDLTNPNTPEHLREFKNANNAQRLAMIKTCMQMISQLQIQLAFKPFFCEPIDIDKFQDCVERFNNFELVSDLDGALRRIELAKKKDKTDAEKEELRRLQQDPTFVGRGPDAAEAHIRWEAFAILYKELGLPGADFWVTLLPSLSKGSAITFEALKDHEPGVRGIQRRKLTEAEIERLRREFDPLRPAASDSQAEKDRKYAALRGKVKELLRDIVFRELHCKELF